MATLTWHFASKEIKRRERAFYRKHWWRLLVVVAAVGISAVVLALAFPTVSVPLWLTVTIAVVLMLGTMAPLLDGTYNLTSGVEAERWTSKELRKELGPEWHAIDWIAFEHHDVDHVVVGPGGVFAVETKYTDSCVDLDTARGQRRADEWVAQALDNARSVRHVLWSVEPRMRVSAAVIVWGAEVTGTPLLWNGVPIRHGRELRGEPENWNATSARLSTTQVDAIVQRLLEFREMRIKHERSGSRNL